MSLHVPEIIRKPPGRSGHVCVYFEDNVFVWGGYNDDDGTDHYIAGSSVWIYNINTCLWRQVECTGEVPSGRSGACATHFGQTMYLFGGHCHLNEHCNDLYSLDLVTCRWENLTECVKGNRPLPRDKFGCWTFRNRIIYFGGYGPRLPCDAPFVEDENMRGWNAQLVILHINSNNTWEWKYPNSKGGVPQARAAHGMATVGNTGYLFGGRHSGGRDNDLHSLDLDKYEWSGRLPVSGPCARSWQIFVPCASTNILMHGGFDANSQELEDAWLLDVNSFTWLQIDIFNKLSVPRTRLWHTACNTDHQGEVVIFGGCSTSFFGPSTEYSNEIMLFNSSPRKLQRLCEDVVVKNNTKICLLPQGMFRALSARLKPSTNITSCGYK